MSVEFSEELQVKSPSFIQQPQYVGLPGLVLKTGIVKSQFEAQWVLIGIALIFFVISAGLLLLSSAAQQNGIVAPPGKEIIYPLNEPPRLKNI